jgi:hypothetical protein
MARLFIAEIMMHRDSEEAKQKLETQPDYTFDLSYKSVDDHSIGFIDAKLIDSFFKKCKLKNISPIESLAIIRRFDLTSSGKISKQEFI